MCPIGGRPMRRSFGSGLANTLFDFADDRMAGLVKQRLTSAINTYVPHVNVISIDVQHENKNVTVLVEFSLREEPSKVVQRAVKIDKRTTMNMLAVRSR
jgi:phage baseplate assembly protein W